MSSLITEQALKAIPGTFTAALSNLASVVSSLTNLQQSNPAAFMQYESEISSLLKGFDPAGNIGNTLGNLTDLGRKLSETSISPDNIAKMTESMSDIASRIDNTNAVYNSGQQVVAQKTSVQQVVAENKPGGEIVVWPKNLGKYWFAMGFRPYQFSTKLFGGSGHQPIFGPPKNSIIMPIPSNLTDTFQVAFQDTSITNEIGKVAGGGVNLLAGAFGGRSIGRSILQTQMLSGAGGILSGAATLTGVVQGMAINPATTLMMQGPMLKEHSFSWKLSPSSEQEALELHKLIKGIKYAMSPSIGFSSFILNYPHMVSCYLYNQDKLYEFKPAMITAFSINYSPSGHPSFYKSTDHKGGYSTEVEMKIQIKELEAWLKDDFKPGP